MPVIVNVLRCVSLAATLAVAHAQEPVGGVVVGELRTSNAALAATLQRALRSAPWDPRKEADTGSIRVRLRHLADQGLRACETSVGPRLAEGVTAELTLSPAAALAAYGPEFTALRTALAPRLGALAAAGDSARETGAALWDAAVLGLQQVSMVRATLAGDPFAAEGTLRVEVEIVAREGGQLREWLGALRPASEVAGMPVGAGQVALTLNLGHEGLEQLFLPLVEQLVGAASEHRDAEIADARGLLRVWDGSLFFVSDLDLRTRAAVAIGARDGDAMWRWLCDPDALALRAAARSRAGRETTYALDGEHRGVPLLRIDGRAAGSSRVGTSWGAMAGDALWFGFGAEALAAVRAAIDGVADGAPLTRETASDELLHVAAALPADRSVEGSVSRVEGGICVTVTVER